MVGTDVMSVRHVRETVVRVSNGVLTIVAHNNTSQIAGGDNFQLYLQKEPTLTGIPDHMG